MIKKYYYTGRYNPIPEGIVTFKDKQINETIDKEIKNPARQVTTFISNYYEPNLQRLPLSI